MDKADLTVITSRISNKLTLITLAPNSGLVEIEIPPEERNSPSLTNEELLTLAKYSLILKEHYGQPLDIEWAVDYFGHPVIIQVRLLNLDIADQVEQTVLISPENPALEFSRHPSILAGGVTASRGKACGPAYVLTSDHNLTGVPEGVILVAEQTSPCYVPLLGRVQAIVTDVGSVTGHMASVAREFGIPTLIGTGNATKIITHGKEITVDATNHIIFQGRVEKILERRKTINPMKDSPVWNAAHQALKRIAILNLVDPNQNTFSPAGCQTLHDVIRFAHEIAMREMFTIGDILEKNLIGAVQVILNYPCAFMPST
ncbi:Phosphoenolpyruvate synthase [Desulfovibrionales bacterium]